MVNALTAVAIEEVIATIATQAPVARDLRFLLTLDHIAYELERIGDSIANVAKRARDIASGAKPRRKRRGPTDQPRSRSRRAGMSTVTARAATPSRGACRQHEPGRRGAAPDERGCSVRPGERHERHVGRDDHQAGQHRRQGGRGEPAVRLQDAVENLTARGP